MRCFGAARGPWSAGRIVSVHPSQEVGRRQRWAHVVALGIITTEMTQQIPTFQVLDALGDDFHTEADANATGPRPN